MEYVSSTNGGHVYVDYAHTVDAFEKALTSFKEICNGKLITVFGCGGDRDKSKRSMMGEISSRISDISIITDDNPRNEDSSVIRKEIINSCPGAIEIPSRVEAIKHALSLIQQGDVLVVVGKGHETTQIYRDKIIYHNDKECVKNLNRSDVP
jgi:UDP-N-acetylmuramoyl-L-alanyl-D-glutamate--2,6-diaminopimelate ligase